MGTVRTIPDKPRKPPAIVKLGRPAMTWELVDLDELLACCRRELAFRQRCYPKWVARGTLTQAKADKELELMRLCVEYFVEAVFRCAIGQSPPPPPG